MHNIPTVTRLWLCTILDSCYVALLFCQCFVDILWRSIICSQQYVPFNLWNLYTGWRINKSILNKLFPYANILTFLIYISLSRKLKTRKSRRHGSTQLNRIPKVCAIFNPTEVSSAHACLRDSQYVASASMLSSLSAAKSSPLSK